MVAIAAYGIADIVYSSHTEWLEFRGGHTMSTTVFAPQPGYHYVPVLPEHVADVEEFLRGLDAGTRDTATELADEITDALVTDELITDDLLVDIAAGSRKATVIVGQVMDILARQPEQPMNLVELAERTGRELSQMQTVWTHFSRYLRARYGHKHWPVGARSGYRFEPPVGGEEVYYWMTPEIAERWRKIRGV
jgi:hypothetical protein